MKSVDQHCAEKHLHRYLAKFVTKVGVSDRALKGIVGKRLKYNAADF